MRRTNADRQPAWGSEKVITTKMKTPECVSVTFPDMFQTEEPAAPNPDKWPNKEKASLIWNKEMDISIPSSAISNRGYFF